MKPSRHFFVRNVYFGQVPTTPLRVHNEFHTPSGRALFCPICAEVWALFPVDSQETFVEHALCDKHQSSPSRPYPGGIMVPWEEAFNADLPLELLKREFLITYEIRKNND